MIYFIPKQEQWRKVINNFYAVLPLALESKQERKFEFDILEMSVNSCHYVCGTVHCVGGWYAISVHKDKAYSSYLTWLDGARRLSKDLGFIGLQHFRLWADKQPHLWGNKLGNYMFNNPGAYDHGNGPAKHLEDVIKHFEFVADNCARYGRKYSLRLD